MAKALKHVVLFTDDVAKQLGETVGSPRRMWVEEGGEYLHMIMEWDGEPGSQPEGFSFVAPGSYVEVSNPAPMPAEPTMNLLVDDLTKQP